MLGGARGGLRLMGVDASAELTFAKRFNYLFQNGFANPGGHGTANIRSVTLTTRLTPGARP